MRYYGTVTGRMLDKFQQKVYQEGEEPEYWDGYSAEIVNVHDDAGNEYGVVTARVTQKTALRLEHYIVPDNYISFDCREIHNGEVIGIRNVCSSKVGIGVGRPYDIWNIQEFIDKFGHRGACNFCKYAKHKKQCEQYHVG